MNNENQDFNCHNGWVNFVVFSPDGKTVASASDDCAVSLWDAKTGKESHRLQRHDYRVGCVAFSPDGTMVASGSDDGTVRL